MVQIRVRPNEKNLSRLKLMLVDEFNSAAGIRTRVSWVRAMHPNQLDYGGCRDEKPGAIMKTFRVELVTTLNVTEKLSALV